MGCDRLDGGMGEREGSLWGLRKVMWVLGRRDGGREGKGRYETQGHIGEARHLGVYII